MGTSRSTIGGGGRGCHKFVPALRGNGAKKAPPGDLFDQPPGEMSLIRGKLPDRVRDHAVLSLEGVVLVTSPGKESSYLRPPQSLKHSTGKTAFPPSASCANPLTPAAISVYRASGSINMLTKAPVSYRAFRRGPNQVGECGLSQSNSEMKRTFSGKA